MKRILSILCIFVLIISIALYKLIENHAVNNTSNNSKSIESSDMMKIYIKVNDNVLSATLNDNSSTDALIEKLKQKDITIELHDYGNFEKVGDLGFSLPRNDEEITTVPGDIILYLGNQITIYYDKNTWNFTKLGKIDNISQKELKHILGKDKVKVTFSLYK